MIFIVVCQYESGVIGKLFALNVTFDTSGAGVFLNIYVVFIYIYIYINCIKISVIKSMLPGVIS